MVTEPRSALVSPTMIRMLVLLPAPLGPRKPVTRPSWATKLMSSTAVKPPYFLVRFSTLIMAPSLSQIDAKGISRRDALSSTKVGGVARLQGRAPPHRHAPVLPGAHPALPPPGFAPMVQPGTTEWQ